MSKASCRGADVVYDTVGGALFEPALATLGSGGRFVAIASAGERRVGFDLIDFYRREIRLFGVDSRSLDTVACASILERLRDGFASGALRASSIARTIPLEEGSRRTPPWLRERVRGRPSSVRVRAAFVAEVARVRISR